VLLAYLERHGTFHRAAKVAGVSEDTVLRERHRDPEFDRACEHARQVHADGCEEALEGMARESKNPVGLIVRLKAIRPAQYIERSATLAVRADLTSGPSSEEAEALLRQMLQDCTDATRRLLTVGGAPTLPPWPEAQ